MRAEIRNRPDYASLHVRLSSGEQVVTETGSMMGMDPALKLESTLKGGLLAAAKRALMGESLILNTWTATGEDQRLDLAPSQPGDVEAVRLDGRPLIVQRGSFLACTPGVSLDAKWAGARGFFSGEGLIMIRATGSGDLWLSSYGAIAQVDVDGVYQVDTTHVVAFDESLEWSVTRVGGLKSLLLSQEGLMCQFTGRGRVWFQTRSAPNLASFLHPFRRVKPKPPNND
jgi:uncharacterized protein (TIGR00266 family)